MATIGTQIGAEWLNADERAQFWKYCLQVTGHARGRAKRKGMPFDIAAHDVDRLLVDQRWLCAITGIPLTPPGKDRDKYGRSPWGPSLDRIVPELGYVKGNLRVTCLMVNTAINEWGLDNFLLLCARMNDPSDEA